MFNTPTPSPDELPTPRQLLRSTVIAVVVASVLLVTVVLPAEYGVDPTGVGDILGLKRMGEIKVALANEAAADAASDSAARAAAEQARTGSGSPTGAAATVAPATGSVTTRSDVAEVVLQPGESKSIDLLMRQGAKVLFEWWTDGGVVGVAARGAPASSAPLVPSGSQGGTSLDAAEGELVAASDGLHGWSWRNQGRTVITVTLHVQGDYQELREVK